MSGYQPGAHIPGTNYYSNPYQAFDDVSVDPNNSLIVAHGALMFIAFGIAAPLAVALGRFGRGRDWMQSHWWLHLAVGVFAFIAFWLAFAYMFATQIPSFMGTDPHGILGLICLILFFCQMILGAINHYLYTPTRVSTPIQNWIHIVLGYLLIILCGANVGVGIWRYFQWYGLDNSQMWIWLGSFIGWFIVFCGLLAFLGECVYPLFSTTAARRMAHHGRDAAYEEDEGALVQSRAQSRESRYTRDSRDDRSYYTDSRYSDRYEMEHRDREPSYYSGYDRSRPVSYYDRSRQPSYNDRSRQPSYNDRSRQPSYYSGSRSPYQPAYSQGYQVRAPGGR